MLRKSQNSKLPPYTIRVDARVRRVKLAIQHSDELVVVIPRGFDKRRIPAILADNMEAVKEVFDNAAILTERQKARPPVLFPESILCQALDTSWDTAYVASDSPGRVSWQERGGIVKFSGDIDNRKLVFKSLRRWLLNTARTHLDPWLHSVSKELELPYARAIVGMQRTRWGSCSGKGTIALNCNLLFQPPEVVRHVMVHELAHTVHANHSAAFWTLVEQLDPDFKHLRSLTKLGHQNIPDWVWLGA